MKLVSLDLVTCYLTSDPAWSDEVDVGQVFTQVYQHRIGGFIFDVHSIYQIDAFFQAILIMKC